MAGGEGKGRQYDPRRRPHVRGLGRLLAGRDRRFLSADEPDSQGGLYPAGTGDPRRGTRGAEEAGGKDPVALQPGAESWAQAYVASGDLAAEVAKLKAQNGKPMVAYGGAGFARSLIAHDLVDQFDLAHIPVVLGQGLPIFRRADKAPAADRGQLEGVSEGHRRAELSAGVMQR